MKALVLLFAVSLSAQQPSSVSTQLQVMLDRTAAGHSPTDEEIHTVESAPGLSDPTAAQQAEPFLARGLDSPDAAMRQYTLAMLLGMQTLPDPDPKAGPPPPSPPAPPPVALFKAEVARQFAPLVPRIAAHLVDESPENRTLAATVLGGYVLAPPPSVFPPLYAFLKRDDAPGPVGLAVVSDLLRLGPVAPASVTAISQYLHRSDQPLAARTELVDTIANEPKQNASVNKALLTYLDADDPALRGRLILSLPQLDLSPDTYADTHARITQLADGGQDDLQVVKAAKAVATCWTAVQMTTGCPVY